MLKWAFNEPRLSYLPNSTDHFRATSLNELNHLPGGGGAGGVYNQTTISPTQLSRWQSIESNCLHDPNDENQITSTPLLASCKSPASQQQQHRTDELNSRKLDSLRDLSNIYPEQVNVTPKMPTHRTPRTPKRQNQNRNATTLPTLDVNEYSPSSALIPGPILALRGLSIPDAYFKKPRYLEATPTITTAQPATSSVRTEDSLTRSLSSSQMDDSTLERMIDAIIASSHKETKITHRLTRQTQLAMRTTTALMSPTYTPAFDPASDLDEIWWSAEKCYLQGGIDQAAIAGVRTHEQLLCTPKSHKSQLLESSFNRRRQRPVRRKRKLKSFRRTMQKSARKLLRVGSSVSVAAAAMPQLNEVDEGNCTNATPSQHIQLSPDSGHNSSSGDSIKTEDHEGHHHKSIDAATCDDVEVTQRRRLNFFKNSL